MIRVFQSSKGCESIFLSISPFHGATKWCLFGKCDFPLFEEQNAPCTMMLCSRQAYWPDHSIGGKYSPVQCTWINTTKNHSRIRWTTSSVTQDVTKPCYLLLISLNHYWGTRICSIDISKCINAQWPPVSIKLCSVALHATSKGNLSLHFCLCLATWAAQTTMGNFNSWNLSFFCFSLFDNVTTMQERLLLSFRSSSRFLLKWQNHKEQVKTLALVKTVLK